MSREPRAALVLWQALGLAAGLATVGAVLALGVAPLGGDLPGALLVWARGLANGDPSAGLGLFHAMLVGAGLALLGWLFAVTGLSTWRTWRSRTRHRELVDLVSTPWPGGSARVIDHPAAAAYCLPGHGSRVVVTTGALGLLDDDELDAVLAHENAHLAERHDLVILPFTAWASALPWLRGPRLARTAVEGLVEMVADDRACVGRERHVLAAALARVGSGGVAGRLGRTPPSTPCWPGSGACSTRRAAPAEPEPPRTWVRSRCWPCRPWRCWSRRRSSRSCPRPWRVVRRPWRGRGAATGSRPRPADPPAAHGHARSRR